MIDKLPCKNCLKDVKPILRNGAKHLTAYCPDCDKYIKHVGSRTPEPEEEVYQPSLYVNGKYQLPEFTFGIHEGIPIYEFDEPHMLSYLKWAKGNAGVWKRLDEITQFAIIEKLKEHDYEVDFPKLNNQYY